MPALVFTTISLSHSQPKIRGDGKDTLPHRPFGSIYITLLNNGQFYLKNQRRIRRDLALEALLAIRPFGFDGDFGLLTLGHDEKSLIETADDAPNTDYRNMKERKIDEKMEVAQTNIEKELRW